MSKWRPHRKDIYNKDYMRTDQGSYVYTGVYYMYDLPAGKLKLLKLAYLSISLVLAILFTAGGYLNNPGSRVLYVILPYITMFLPIAFIISDTVKIIFSDNKMTFKQYNRSVLQLKRSVIALIAISAAAITGEISYLIFNGTKALLSSEIPYFLVCFAIFCISVAFYFIQRKAVCISTEN